MVKQIHLSPGAKGASLQKSTISRLQDMKIHRSHLHLFILSAQSFCLKPKLVNGGVSPKTAMEISGKNPGPKGNDIDH